MALDIQTIAMTGSYVPYERPPQPLTLWSAIPRGLQSFLVDSQQLDAKAINDTQLLQLTATLPPNFGYVMNAAMVNIAQDKASAWQNLFNLNLQSFYRGPEAQAVGLSSNWVQTFPESSIQEDGRSMSVQQAWPTFPIIGTPGTSGILIVLSGGNRDSAAALVGVVNAFISFWQFDLEQIRKFPINSPNPVHSR